jgi:hypothetical protein
VRSVFLHQLGPAQRHAFCRLAQLVIGQDRVIDIREEVALDTALAEMGLRKGDLPPAPRTLREMLPELEAFDSLESRRLLLLELAVLLCSDREVDPAEESLLQRLAAHLDVEEELLPRVEAWAHDYHQLLGRGRALLAPEWDQSGEGWIEDEGQA